MLAHQLRLLLLGLGKLGIVDFQGPPQIGSLGLFRLKISSGRFAGLLGFRNNQLAALGSQALRNLLLNLLPVPGELRTL